MSEVSVSGVVLTHSSLAEGLVEATRAITGIGDEALIGISNSGRSPERLLEEVRRIIVGKPTILFTDLPSGSCSLVARRLLQTQEEVSMISGVNLPLLLDFVLHRHLPLDELEERLIERGRNAIELTTARR